MTVGVHRHADRRCGPTSGAGSLPARLLRPFREGNVKEFGLACAGWQGEVAPEFSEVLARLKVLGDLSGCAALEMPAHNAFWGHPHLRADVGFLARVDEWIEATMRWAEVVQPSGRSSPTVGEPSWKRGEVRPAPPRLLAAAGDAGHAVA